MAEGLVIPISTPGGEESAAVLDRIADKLEEVGGAADKSATKMGAGATSSSAAIGRIATAAEGTKTAVERLEESGNRGLHALSEKASELAGSMGGAAGKIADVGLKSLAAFGGIGLQATAAVGAVLMLYNAYVQYETEQRAVKAASEELAAAQVRLGGTYSSLTEAANADGDAEQRVAAIRAASAAIVQEQVATLGRGYTQQETDQLTQLSHAIADSTRARLGMTAAQIESTIETGTAAQQQLVLGVVVEHSTNAETEHANVLLRATLAREHSIRVQLEEIRSRIHGTQGNRSAISALEDLRTATAQQTTAQHELTVATAATAAAESRATAVTREQEGNRIQALAASDAAARATAAAAAAARARHASSGGGSAPSEQQLRAQAEGLRLAQAANDNARQSATLDEQRIELGRRFEFATREVTLAQESHHDRSRRLTTALQAQTEAVNALHASQSAYRAGQEAITALIAAEADAQRDATAAEKASLITREAQVRQADARSLAMQRAREDAEAASAAEKSLSSEDVTSGISPRAALLSAEETATRELARATVDLTTARREEGDASISYEERTARMTTALAAQTGALQRQRAAQRAVTAEVDKIKTDRTDALAASAKGLGDGLVSAGLAAAFAGENIGAALQKQLAASLQALAIESAQKALYSLATGFFYLATGNPAAVPAFTSAAIFGAVAVGAGAVSAAIAPSAAPAAAGGGAVERASSVSPGGAGGMGGGSGAGPIVNNYYAPIVGGRQSTDAETGVRIDRYNDAARARLRRAA